MRSAKEPTGVQGGAASPGGMTEIVCEEGRGVVGNCPKAKLLDPTVPPPGEAGTSVAALERAKGPRVCAAGIADAKENRPLCTDGIGLGCVVYALGL